MKRILSWALCAVIFSSPVAWSAQTAIVSTDTRQEAWAKETANNADIQTNINSKQDAMVSGTDFYSVEDADNLLGDKQDYLGATYDTSAKLDALFALYYNKTETDILLNAKVGTTGDETVAGVKTFSSSPIVPAPTTDMQSATKKYVDDNAGGAVSDTVYGVGWNADTGAASKNAIYDKIETIAGGTMTYPEAGIPNSTGSAWGTSYSLTTLAAGLDDIAWTFGAVAVDLSASTVTLPNITSLDWIDGTDIDWGLNGDQISAVDLVIADAGAKITATEVEGALQENRTAIDLNTAKTTSTAWDDITGPDSDARTDIYFDSAAEATTFTTSFNTAGSSFIKINNEVADVTNPIYLLELEYTDDGQANADFIKLSDNNGDVLLTVQEEGNLATIGTIKGRAAYGTDVGSSTNHDTAELHNVLYHFTGAATVTLDAAADAGYGAQVGYRVRDDAEAAVVDPQLGEKINLDGTPQAAGVAITATGKGSYIILVSTTDTDGSGTDGWESWGNVGFASE